MVLPLVMDLRNLLVYGFRDKGKSNARVKLNFVGNKRGSSITSCFRRFVSKRVAATRKIKPGSAICKGWHMSNYIQSV